MKIFFIKLESRRPDCVDRAAGAAAGTAESAAAAGRAAAAAPAPADGAAVCGSDQAAHPAAAANDAAAFETAGSRVK